MKHLTILTILAAVSITVCGFTVKSLFAVTTGYFLDNSGICQSATLDAAQFTTTGVTQAKIVSVGGSQVPLYSTRINSTQ